MSKVPKQYKVAEQRLGVARKALQEIANGKTDSIDDHCRLYELMYIARSALEDMERIKVKQKSKEDSIVGN